MRRVPGWYWVVLGMVAVVFGGFTVFDEADSTWVRIAFLLVLGIWLVIGRVLAIRGRRKNRYVSA